ncbi:transaldolase family protein [Streptomyces sp. NPDC002346]
MVSDTLARLAASGVSIWLDDWRVSIGVAPRLAHDTVRTIAEARGLWWLVDRPNLFVKIPAVKQGLGAIGGCLAEGLSINVTLLFSLDRYDAVAEAFLTGMERAQDAGRDLSRTAPVASFFVLRVDTEIDRRLDRLGGFRAAALHGCAANANARIAYEHYERMLATERWKRLERAGVRPQRPSWASTGAEGPGIRRHAVRRGPGRPGRGQHHAGGDTERCRRARRGSGRPDPRRLWRSAQKLEELAALGVDYADVVQVLEDEGVERFDASWNESLEKLAVSPHESDSGRPHGTDRSGGKA